MNESNLTLMERVLINNALFVNALQSSLAVDAGVKKALMIEEIAQSEPADPIRRMQIDDMWGHIQLCAMEGEA